MPTFTWTLPDPLNNKAKTLSIYVTELQTAINVKRTAISLVPITFIDQSVGKKFRLDAVEELKTVTNDLAILYGYPTGVEDTALLGRPYVTITRKYGKEVCHYPILNDLRVVLNLLVRKIKLPKLCATNWRQVWPVNYEFANWEIASDFFSNIPIDVQTGVGGVCPQGPPICPNTIPGVFISSSLRTTERSLIVGNKEGPIGGPYYDIPQTGLPGVSSVFDETYFYGVLGLEVKRWRRDGAGSTEIVCTMPSTISGHGIIPDGRTLAWGVGGIDKDYIYMLGFPWDDFLGINTIVYSRSSKIPGGTPSIPGEFFLNASGASADIWNGSHFPLINAGDGIHKSGTSLDNVVIKDGKIYGIYKEYIQYLFYKHTYPPAPDDYQIGPLATMGSCFVEIPFFTGLIFPPGGTGGINISDLYKDSIAWPYPMEDWVVYRLKHESIVGDSNNYLWWTRETNPGMCLWPNELPPSEIKTIVSGYSGGGSEIPSVDYSGELVCKALYPHQIDTVESYLRRAEPTIDYVISNFITTSRIEGDPFDTIEVSWNLTPGTFRYIMKWGTTPTAINFVGKNVYPHENINVTSFTVPHGFPHYVQMEVYTGQGSFKNDYVEFPVPIPSAPILLSVDSGSNSGELAVTYGLGSPFTVVTGSIVIYKLVGDTGPWSSVQAGLTGLYTITDLIPGANYDVKMRVYNDSGYSGLSNMLTGAAKL
jgi:hypothetical protein